MSLLFIGGVHGAGKTTFARELSRRLGFTLCNAGELIRGARSDRAAMDDKRVLDVAANQEVLVAAVRTTRAEAPDLILDGHFCVFDANGDICPIPLPVFEQLGLAVGLIVDTRAEEVLRRLSARAAGSFSLEKIRHFARMERDHAITVCDQLSVPLFVWGEEASIGSICTRVLDALREPRELK